MSHTASGTCYAPITREATPRRPFRLMTLEYIETRKGLEYYHMRFRAI